MVTLRVITLLCIVLFLNSTIQIKAQELTQNIYISNSGNDFNTGTLESPVKSFEAAIKLIKKDNSSKNINIRLRKGLYFLENTIKFDNLKNKKITIEPYLNEKIQLLGGLVLDKKKFEYLESTDINYLRFSPDIRKRIIKYNTTNINTSFGSIKESGFGHGKQPVFAELFYGDQVLNLSRWPNDKKLKIDSIINPEKVELLSNKNTNRRFIYEDVFKRQWNTTNNIWVNGFFNQGWANENLQINSIDQNQRIVELKSTPTYGIISSKGGPSKWDNDIDKKSIRGIFFYNIIEELDIPGEYFIDTINHCIYTIPLEEKLNKDLQISILEVPLVAINNCENIIIKNIEFNLSRNNAIEIYKSQNITILNSTIENIGLDAIKLNNTLNVMINNCKLNNIGGIGINIIYDKDLEMNNSNIIITDCEIKNYARIYKSYNPAIQIAGEKVTIKNCYIHDSPGQGVIFTGINHIIKDNYFQNLCKEFSDIGAIYTGRDISSVGTAITNNIFDNIKANENFQVAAIYMDDGAGGIKIANNLFYQCGTPNKDYGFGAIHINGGSFSNVSKNTFIDCYKAITGGAWSNPQWTEYLSKETTKEKINLLKKINQKGVLNGDVDINKIIDPTKADSRVNVFENNSIYNTSFETKNRKNKIVNTVTINSNPISNTLNLYKNYKKLNKISLFRNSNIEFNKIGINN